MAQIDNIVQVQITRETTQIDITSFDIPLLLVAMDDTDTAFATERVKTYTSLDEVADDFSPTENAYIMASKLLSNDVKPNQFKIGKVDTETGSLETYVEALNAVQDIDDTWYVVMIDSHLQSDILAVAATIQAQRKLFFTSTSEVAAYDAVSTTDTGSQLVAGSYTRTIIMYSVTADTEFPEASWVGRELPPTPGSNTWEYKSLAGVTVSNLTATQITVLEGKGYNYYITVKGVPITRRGKSAGNVWVDEMVGIDWLYARLQEQIFFRLVNTRKIPFTAAGATMIENEIRSVLSQGQTNGLVDTYTVQAPVVLAIPEMQRAARIMGDFKFTARLQGAVSIVRIVGTVTA